MTINTRVIVDNIDFFMEGLKITILLSVIAMGCALLGGVLLCFARLSKSVALRYPARIYIDLIRSTPLLLMIFWFLFLMPRVTGVRVSPWVAGLIALSAYFATHIAEIMRAGIQAIPKGQAEAASSTGLGYWQTMREVILPQAIRHMTPALISRFVALLKSTSLVYIIGVIEFFRAATLINNREFASFEIFTFVALVYFLLCFAISRFGAWCQRRLGAHQMRDVEASLGW